MYKEMRNVIVGSAFALLISGCGASDDGLKVTQAEYGEAWPFTVDSLVLLCDENPPKALAKTIDGKVYALSGSAKSKAKEHGWLDGYTITKPSKWVPSVPMDYSDIVQRAQGQCSSH